jgi:tRNA (cmo5U34)-methyltransferase
MSQKDNYKPEGKWSFDEGVTKVFEDMISRSIPGYSTMRDCVVRVAYPILTKTKSPFLLDLGCSRGETIYQILNSLPNQNTVTAVGVDSSEPMIDVATESFSNFDNVNFVHADLQAADITPGKYSLITSVLTAQFIPLDVRQDFFQRVNSGLSFDGAFVVVEKILGESPVSQGFLVDIYHTYKSDSGYTEEQIEEKRKALQGVLVPLRGSENERMLKDAGFTNVQRFWQCLNFAGWIAFK